MILSINDPSSFAYERHQRTLGEEIELIKCTGCGVLCDIRLVKDGRCHECQDQDFQEQLINEQLKMNMP